MIYNIGSNDDDYHYHYFSGCVCVYNMSLVVSFDQLTFEHLDNDRSHSSISFIFSAQGTRKTTMKVLEMVKQHECRAHIT